MALSIDMVSVGITLLLIGLFVAVYLFGYKMGENSKKKKEKT